MAEANAATPPLLSPESDSTSLTFTLFPKLPMEIQLKIWKHSIPGPRVIKVKVFAPQTIYDPAYEIDSNDPLEPPATPLLSLGNDAEHRREMEKAVRGLVLSTNTKSPGMLFACRISRDVALERFTACLELENGKRTRFNLAHDTIFVAHTTTRFLPPLPVVDGPSGQPFLPPNYGRCFSGVETLALGTLDFFVSGPHQMALLLSQFRSLKSVVMLRSGKATLVSLVQSGDQVLLQTLEEATPSFPGQIKQGNEGCAALNTYWKRYVTRESDKRYGRHLKDLELKSMYLIKSSEKD